MPLRSYPDLPGVGGWGIETAKMYTPFNPTNITHLRVSFPVPREDSQKFAQVLGGMVSWDVHWLLHRILQQAGFACLIEQTHQDWKMIHCIRRFIAKRLSAAPDNHGRTKGFRDPLRGAADGHI